MLSCYKRTAAILLAPIAGLIVLACSPGALATPPPVDDDGTIVVASFSLPESAYLSQETRAALKRARDAAKKGLEGVNLAHLARVRIGLRLGVTADLHAWEGMTHAFQYGTALPESREAYNVIVKFFDARLGT